ncbi:MAG: hypothetical protein WCK32_02660 [Chlorobiaceae bacterium]
MLHRCDFIGMSYLFIWHLDTGYRQALAMVGHRISGVRGKAKEENC